MALLLADMGGCSGRCRSRDLPLFNRWTGMSRDFAGQSALPNLGWAGMDLDNTLPDSGQGVSYGVHAYLTNRVRRLLSAQNQFARS